MSIDAELQQYYAGLAQAFPAPAAPGGTAPDAATRRARFRAIAAAYAMPRPADMAVEDIELPLAGRTLAARLYRPHRAGPAAVAADELPLLVYFHGGGWVVGDLDTHDSVATMLAADGGIAVASVDYRLAPEYCFPAACDDALDATLWFAEHRARLGFATGSLGVAGDSAGGYIAAFAAREANARVAGLVRAQLLLYPVVRPRFDTASYQRHATGPGLSTDEMKWYWQAFLGQAAPADAHTDLMAAAPQRVLPDAVVLVAGNDPLCDEGREYARFITQHGGRAELLVAHDMTHGFARLQAQSKAAHEWMRSAARATALLLGRGAG